MTRVGQAPVDARKQASPPPPPPQNDGRYSGAGDPQDIKDDPAPQNEDGKAPGGGTTLKTGGADALDRFAPEINRASEATGVPANLLGAMLWAESRGDLAAVSQNGQGGADTGLMQMGQVRFDDLQSKHPELQGMSNGTPEGNIMAAAFFMKDLKEQFGTWDLALRGYNSGELSVNENDPNDIVTQPDGNKYGDPEYIRKVNNFLDIIENGGVLPP